MSWTTLSSYLAGSAPGWPAESILASAGHAPGAGLGGITVALFSNPIPLYGPRHMLLILPLCLAIAIVYKTIRCEKTQEIPVASGVLWVTMVAGMYGVGFAVWLVNWLLV